MSSVNVPAQLVSPAPVFGRTQVVANDDRALTAPLDPAADSEHAMALASRIEEAASSRNTERARRAALAYWSAWFQARYQREFAIPPAGLPVPVIVQFLVDHALVPREPGSSDLVLGMGTELAQLLVDAGVKKDLAPPKLATIEQRLALLSAEHRRLQAQGGAYSALYNPCLAPEVKHLQANLRRSYARPDAPAAQSALAAVDKAPALTSDLLQLVLATCDDSLVGKRDRALLAFAFASGGRRRSEVAAAQLDRLRPLPGPEPQFIYELRHSKTNQAGLVDERSGKPVLGAAGAALAQWLAALRAAGKDLDQGPVFRRIFRGTTIGDKPLTSGAIWSIVKARCRLAGLGGDYSPHSLRSGFLTDVGRRPGIPFHEGMAMSGHTDMRTAMGYTRPGAMAHSSAARLLDGEAARSAEHSAERR